MRTFRTVITGSTGSIGWIAQEARRVRIASHDVVTRLTPGSNGVSVSIRAYIRGSQVTEAPITQT